MITERQDVPIGGSAVYAVLQNADICVVESPYSGATEGSPAHVDNPWPFNHSPTGIFRPDYAVGHLTFTRKRGISDSKNRWPPDSQNLNLDYDVYAGATVTPRVSFWKMRRVYKA